MRIGTFEWHIAGKHLKQDVSKSPNVDTEALILSIDDLWTLIVDSSNKSVSPDIWRLLLWHLALCYFVLLGLWLLINIPGISKINDFDIIVLIQHDVLRFHIPVHYALLHDEFLVINKLSEQ